MVVSAQLHTQTQSRPKRLKRRETTISTPPPSPPDLPSPAMDPHPNGFTHTHTNAPHYPSSYTKFNTALNAGLLNPMSPPPTRSSPTLFEMMANEHDPATTTTTTTTAATTAHNPTRPTNPRHPPHPLTVQERQLLLQERVAEILGSSSPGNQLNDPETGDVRLTLTSRDGLTVSMNVHRQILVTHSRFFASKLSDRWSKQQRTVPYLVEISDCDDVEVYVETLRLMYCNDLRRRLMREEISKVLAVLRVSAAIAFDSGVLACLEHLEASPWAEDEEEKVAALLSQLRLDSSGDVLKRIDPGNPIPNPNPNPNEDVLPRLLRVVLDGKDEKARRDMKSLVSKMLRENPNPNGHAGADVSRESIYTCCDDCLAILRRALRKVVNGGDPADAAVIARQSDNLHWLLDILIDRRMAEDFVRKWAGEDEMAEAHAMVPAIHRYEISRVTARVLVGIGKGQVLVEKEVRWGLLRTWLEPLYEDFGWMRRAWKGMDRHSIEEGLGNTILTLPMAVQQEVLLRWFDRFLNSGEDCPNIQRGFEVWWRRAFWRRNGEGEGRSGGSPLRIAAAPEEGC